MRNLLLLCEDVGIKHVYSITGMCLSGFLQKHLEKYSLQFFPLQHSSSVGRNPSWVMFRLELVHSSHLLC